MLAQSDGHVVQQRHHIVMNKYIIIFAKDEKGEDIPYRFMLSLSKPIKSIEKEFMAAVMGTDGVDRIEVHGRYTAEIGIGRAFDAKQVLDALTPKLEAALSDIVLPKLIV